MTNKQKYWFWVPLWIKIKSFITIKKCITQLSFKVEHRKLRGSRRLIKILRHMYKSLPSISISVM